MSQNLVYVILILAVIALGIISRVIKINNPLWDHYLGDSLYAIMFFLIISLFWQDGNIFIRLGSTFVLMLLIEFFQLTNIPLKLYESENTIFKIIGILLGTKFSWIEILAYAIGLISAGLAEYIFRLSR